MPDGPPSPRGAAELFDFDDLDDLGVDARGDAGAAADGDGTADASSRAAERRRAPARLAPVAPTPETLAAAEAAVGKVLGDAVQGLLRGLSRWRPLPLPAGAAVYEGEMSHEDFGDDIPLRLETEYAEGRWQGEWVAMDQREAIELELDVPEAVPGGSSHGQVQIRSAGSSANLTELRGEVAADGVLQGEVLQGGRGGGRFELRPAASEAPLPVPSDWAAIKKARDIFVAGWGGFDVPIAYEAFQASLGKDSLRHAGVLPSVEVLRSYGYVHRFFPSVSDPLQRDRLRHALLVPSSLLAQYVVRHAAYWSDAAHANRLDEVAQHFDGVPSSGVKAAMKEVPGALLNRLSRERAVTGHKFVRFSHLSGVLQPAIFCDEGRQLIEKEAAGMFKLSVLDDSHSVAKAAQELNNCAATYVGDVRRKRCALVALHREGKLVALGEWDLHDRKWSQISEHSDEPVRPEWQRMYDHLEGDGLFPLEGRVVLPGNRGDSVSVFHPAALNALDPLCRSGGLSRSLVGDWTSLLPSCERYPEASSALLLWVAEDQGSCDLMRHLIRDRGADVDTMTDCGWTALMLATEAGNEEMVELLLDAEADVNAKGAHEGRTALMMASSSGSLPLVHALLEKKADLDIVARLNGKTALIEAVECSSWTAASLLVERNAGLDAQRYDGRTALMLAAQAGQTGLVEEMAGGGAKLDLKSEDGTTALLAAHAACRWPALRALVEAGAGLEIPAGPEKRTILMLAALAGHVETMELLVEKRALLESRHESGETALAMAARSRQWASVRCLGGLSADLNAKCEDGHVALTLAAEVGESKLVDFLGGQGADLDAPGPNGSSALAYAAVAGHLDVIRALSRHGADLDSAGDGGQAALVSAALVKKWPSLQLLVELGARLEVRDPSNRTALMIAAMHGHSKTVSSLLERRAMLEAQASDGSTALVVAAKERQWMLVRRLADARANLEAKATEDTKTVLLLVTEALQWETTVHLAKRGADLNTRGDAGKTALFCAVDCGQDDVVQCLLQRKADPNAPDDNGESPMLRACNRQLEHVMRILFDGGASIDDAVKRASIRRMANILLKWSGADVDEM